MSEMVDRASLAAEKYLHNRADLGAPINYGDLVRAVIAVMREPTSAMQTAGVEAYNKAPSIFVSESNTEHIWQAMIDEALK